MLIVKDGLGRAFDLDANTPLSDTLRALSQSRGVGIGDALVALYNYLHGALAQNSALAKAAAAALTKAETDDATLTAILDGALGKFLLDREGGNPLPVPRTLASAGPPLAYALDAKKTIAAKTGDVTLSFAPTAGATAQIAVLRGPSPSVDPPLALPAGDALLRFSLSGEVDVEGSFKVPFNGGSGAGSAGAGASVEIDALFQWPATTTVAGALVESVGGLASPWDLDVVAADLAPVDASGECRGLRRLAFDLTGDLHLTGTVGLGRSWRYVDKNFAQGVDLNATLGVQADLSLGWSRNGAFRLTVERASDGSVAIGVHRTDGTQGTFGADLTAGLVVTGLGQAAQPIVDDLFPDATGLMQKLRAWSAPGTMLVDRLLAQIGSDDPAVATLAQLLLGRTTSGEAQTQIRDLILAEIKEQVNTYVPFWKQLSQPTALAAQLSAALARRFGAEGDAAALIAQQLQKWLAPALTKAYQDFSAAMTTLATDASDTLAPLLAAFGKIGEDVAALTKAIDADASAVVAPALRLMQRYETIRAQVLDAVTAASKLKLGLGLKLAYSRTTNDTAEVSFRIAQMTDRTRLVYRSLVTGRLDAAWGVLQAAIDAGEIVALDGAFTSAIARSRSLDLSLSFGDASIAWDASSASSATITVEANGMLSVGQGRFTSSNVAKAFGRSSGASFGGTLDVAAALAHPAATLPVAFGFALNYQDKRMQPSELATYLRSLQRVGGGAALFGDDAVRAALAQYGAAPADARVDTVVNLDAATLQRVFDLTTTSNGRARILATARAALFAAGAARDTGVAVLTALAGGTNPAAIAQVLADLADLDAFAIGQRYGAKTGQTLPTTNGADQRVYQDVRNINGLAAGLADALTALAGAPALFVAAQAQTGDQAAQATRYARALDGVNTRVNAGIGAWFEQFGQTDQAPSFAVALLASLAQLADLPAPLLVPVAQVRSAAGTLRVLAF